ncbi:tRNA pseudouridine synthase B [Porphyridium purpureum]|uniref:tRNA pseudouridine(55) synthase n=1 Tax=Porphyridium purpureum TaxID=35688 RepID=A0A5J4YTI9_PORPP|nr:tRNA pseudouridine synthase B [Porphyridium purpureum]|eukprot:POR7618..scf227_4
MEIRQNITKARAKAEESGVEKVPEAHFLILDKPPGAIFGLMMVEARRVLHSVTQAALELRYYEYLEKYSVKQKWETIIRENEDHLRKLKMHEMHELEPYESGVTVLAVEGALRIRSSFEEGSNVYDCTTMFGTATDTHLKDGTVTETLGFSHVTEQAMKQTIERHFIGKSLHDADDMPLFENVKRVVAGVLDYEERTVHVRKFDVVEFDLPRVRFRIRCYNGAATVKSLIHDLAKALDSCAHVTEIRRIRCGVFKIKDAVPGDTETLKSLGPKLVERLVHANKLIKDIFTYMEPIETDARPYEPWDTAHRDFRLFSDEEEEYAPGDDDGEKPKKQTEDFDEEDVRKTWETEQELDDSKSSKEAEDLPRPYDPVHMRMREEFLAMYYLTEADVQKQRDALRAKLQAMVPEEERPELQRQLAVMREEAEREKREYEEKLARAAQQERDNPEAHRARQKSPAKNANVSDDDEEPLDPFYVMKYATPKNAMLKGKKFREALERQELRTIEREEFERTGRRK